MSLNIRTGAICFFEYPGDYLDFLDLADELRLSWVELKFEPQICLKDGSKKYSEIKKKAAGMGIGLSLHAPFVGLNIASLDVNERKTSLDKVKESLRAASKMDIHYATVHAGHLKSIEYSQDKWKRSEELNIISLKELVGFGRELGISICMENGNAFKKKFLKHALHPGNMKHIRFEVGSELKFTIDFGHAMYFSRDPSYIISELGLDNVKLSHLHSNFQLSDTHDPLSKGYLNLDMLLERYVKEEWDFPLSIEMKSEKNLRESIDVLYSSIKKKGYKIYGKSQY